MDAATKQTEGYYLCAGLCGVYKGIRHTPQGIWIQGLTSEPYTGQHICTNSLIIPWMDLKSRQQCRLEREGDWGQRV